MLASCDEFVSGTPCDMIVPWLDASRPRPRSANCHFSHVAPRAPPTRQRQQRTVSTKPLPMNAWWAVQATRLGRCASAPLRAACGVRATPTRVDVGAPVPAMCRLRQTPLRTFAQGAFQDVGARVTSRVSALGRQWNEFSGYVEIDKLKNQVAAECALLWR